MDVHSKAVRSYNMSKVKSRDTKPEVRVRKYLFAHGFRYRKNDSRYPGRPDIVLPKYKTAIFVNGCFWHMHAGCKYSSVPKTNSGFWKQKLEQNKQRDENNITQMKDLGWNVIIIWQCEIKESAFESRMDALIKQITDNHSLA